MLCAPYVSPTHLTLSLALTLHHPNLSEEASAFRGLFRNVPNLSFHTLRYPVPMDPFYAIQWPMMWADNFTVA